MTKLMRPRDPIADRKTGLAVLVGVLVVSTVFLTSDYWGRAQSAAVIPYSQFQLLLADGKVKDVTVDADSLTGELKEPSQTPRSPGGPAF